MISTNPNSQELDPSPLPEVWEQSGETEFQFSSHTMDGLLESALTALLKLTFDPRSQPATGTKTLRIRGEGTDLGMLFLALSNSLFDEPDALGMTPIDLSVDGLVRSELGYIGWASVIVVNSMKSERLQEPNIQVVDQRNEMNAYSLTIRLGGASLTLTG